MKDAADAAERRRIQDEETRVTANIKQKEHQARVAKKEAEKQYARNQELLETERRLKDEQAELEVCVRVCACVCVRVYVCVCMYVCAGYWSKCATP